jgi:CubicO group peptidase (beta-lactamase class C family)
MLIGLTIVIGSIATGVTTFIIINSLVKDETFESKIKDFMAEFEIPSLAAGIVDNKSLIWLGGFGEQPELDTVYMIGSITKTFTATAILQLNETGLLNLNDDINKYLPFEVRNPSYPTTAITPLMLLSHKSGMQKDLYWSLEYYLEDHMIDWINANLDWEENILKLEPRPSLGVFLNESLNPNGTYYNSYNWYYKPGIQYRYSNAGFQLLSYLIEEITNQTYMEYLEENIFDPLNMTSTGFEFDMFTGRNAIPYEWFNNSNFEYPFYNINVIGAGNLRSTIGDMAKYLITFINKGNYNGVQLLGSEYVNLMLSVQVSFSGASVEGFDYEGYGLGWNIFTENIRGHGGAVPGFSSNMLFKRSNEGDYGMILLFNRGYALVDDANLRNSFIPRINQLVFNEAEKLI